MVHQGRSFDSGHSLFCITQVGAQPLCGSYELTRANLVSNGLHELWLVCDLC
jgi:hypothetical protein